MKKLIHTILVTMFLLPVLSLTTFSQVLPENPTLADITNLKEDITIRLKKIPNNESEVLTERNWITTSRASIQSLKNTIIRQGQTKPNLEKFRSDLEELAERLTKLNCNDPKEGMKILEGVRKEYNFLIRDNSILDRFEPPKEWIVIEETFDNIFPYFRSTLGAVPINFNTSECAKLKSIFSNQQLNKNINAFIELRKGEIEKDTKDNSDKLNMLNLTEQELTNYSQKLSDAFQKVNTKNSLQTNLYLMILVIGLLSIATIGVVRLFPDNVMREWVESGQVIQFVTVMILLSVIMALGLAGLLTENTLGTLLGGIGGYVLSQGVGRAAARAAVKERQESK